MGRIDQPRIGTVGSFRKIIDATITVGNWYWLMGWFQAGECTGLDCIRCFGWITFSDLGCLAGGLQIKNPALHAGLFSRALCWTKFENSFKRYQIVPGRLGKELRIFYIWIWTVSDSTELHSKPKPWKKHPTMLLTIKNCLGRID